MTATDLDLPLGERTYLNSAQGAVYTARRPRRDGTPNREAFRMWCRRHGVPVLRSGLVCRMDIDIALRQERVTPEDDEEPFA